MSRITYKKVEQPRGRKGHVIHEITVGDTQDAIGPAVLHMSQGTRPETVFDTVMALQAARQAGREERSTEILGEEGLSRAGAEVRLHRPQGILGDAVLGEIVACKCGQFQGRSVGDWQEHLAYKMLQAAARDAG